MNCIKYNYTYLSSVGPQQGVQYCCDTNEKQKIDGVIIKTVYSNVSSYKILLLNTMCIVPSKI